MTVDEVQGSLRPPSRKNVNVKLMIVGKSVKVEMDVVGANSGLQRLASAAMSPSDLVDQVAVTQTQQ